MRLTKEGMPSKEEDAPNVSYIYSGLVQDVLAAMLSSGPTLETGLEYSRESKKSTDKFTLE